VQLQEQGEEITQRKKMATQRRCIETRDCSKLECRLVCGCCLSHIYAHVLEATSNTLSLAYISLKGAIPMQKLDVCSVPEHFKLIGGELGVFIEEVIGV
jgi:hypothetical protein